MAELSTEAAPVAAPRIGPGARLKAGREAQNQSLEQAARHLRLDEPTLAAIESDLYPAHVPSTFLRGYLRAYAKWLELPADDIVAAYNEQQPGEATLAGLKSLLPLPESGRGRSSKWLWLSLLAVVVVLVVVAVVKLTPGTWLEQMRDASVSSTDGNTMQALPPETTSGELSLQLAPEEPVTDAEVVPEPAADTVATSEVVATKPETSAAKPIESTNKPSVTNNQSVSGANASVASSPSAPAQEIANGSGELLEFAFIEDCWIRVTDVGGSVLSVGIKQKGQRIRLSGAAPLTVVLGNPSGVQLRHNGRAIDLTAYPGGRPATLTVQTLANE